ncbi:MAG: DUF2325 domain-containing protein [Candidatus Methanospirareceae archaeon]
MSEDGKGKRGKRRIWEIKPYIICRLLGLIFDERETRILSKDLEIEREGTFLEDFELHRALSRACTTPCIEARCIEEIIERKFEDYHKMMDGLGAGDICKFIEDENGLKGNGNLKDIPLPALIWFAVRSQEEHIEEIEKRIFAAIHIKEHKALRFYDELSRKLPDGNVERLLHRYKRLEREKEELILENKALREDKIRLSQELEKLRKENQELKGRIEKFGSESALEEIEKREKEIRVLKEEIEILSKELREREEELKRRIARKGGRKEKRGKNDEEVGNHSLKGVRIALIGGVESLKTHYKGIVEDFGGVFYYHSGQGIGGKEMEEIVNKADVVFCPVDINSHNVCRYVKKICKKRKKACYFLRSSGLSSLRKELLELMRKK